MLRIDASGKLSFTKKKKTFSKELFIGFTLAFLLHLVLASTFTIARRSQLVETLPILAPVVVSIDIQPGRVTIQKEEESSFVAIGAIEPPEMLELPTTVISKKMEPFPFKLNRSSYSSLEPIPYTPSELDHLDTH